MKSALLAVASAMGMHQNATSMQHLAKELALAKTMLVDCYVIAAAQRTTSIHGNRELAPLLKWIEPLLVNVSFHYTNSLFMYTCLG